MSFNYRPDYEHAAEMSQLFAKSITNAWPDQLSPNKPVKIRSGFIKLVAGGPDQVGEFHWRARTGFHRAPGAQPHRRAVIHRSRLALGDALTGPAELQSLNAPANVFAHLGQLIEFRY